MNEIQRIITQNKCLTCSKIDNCINNSMNNSMNNCMNNYMNNRVDWNCNHTCNCNFLKYNQNQQNIIQTSMDPGSVANQFFNEYYRNVSYCGWNAVTHLFDVNNIVICKDKILGNSYIMLDIFSKMHIKRANYDNLNMKWIVLDNNTMVLNIFGQIQFVLFNEHYNDIIPFTESFILKIIDNNIKCSHHIFDF